MSYIKKIITITEKERIYQKYIKNIIFERKANISGGCIHLYSDSEEWEDQWDDNWFFIDENMRSHAKLFSIESGSDAKGTPTVYYDPLSRTAFFKNNSYYGWLKSVALALMGDVFEDNHNIFSAHAALLNVNNNGVCIIGPSGTGKTTLSYGLLTKKNAKIIADDWFYFKFINGTVQGYRSEKNTYIRADLSQSWKEYSNIMKYAKTDNKGRAIVNLSKVVGKEKITDHADINKLIILRREKGKPVEERIRLDQALRLLVKNDYYNPHILQRNKWKDSVRKKAYEELLKRTEVLLLNTIETPEESLGRIMDFCSE
ncbi:aldolase [Caldisericum sp.]|uniref:aldolase n=1 Tax=Caldisericum sp. TaxID=2499687 RepID=UPI003D0AA907